MSIPQVVSWQAAEAAGERFRELFAGTALAWQIAGHVRRQVEGPMYVVHLAVPKEDPGGYANAVWGRAVDLLCRRELLLHRYAGGFERGPERESAAAGFERDGWLHEVVVCHPDAYGPRLAELTGPAGYWRMLLHRLTLAGALRLHQGRVCLIDRSLAPRESRGTRKRGNRRRPSPDQLLACSPALIPIPCPLESTFFRVARTRLRDPRHRFERPASVSSGTGDWERGVLAEWYPPGFTPYADPRRHPELFDRGRAVLRQFRHDEDRLKWFFQ